MWWRKHGPGEGAWAQDRTALPAGWGFGQVLQFHFHSFGFIFFFCKMSLCYESARERWRRRCSASQYLAAGRCGKEGPSAGLHGGLV